MITDQGGISVLGLGVDDEYGQRLSKKKKQMGTPPLAELRIACSAARLITHMACWGHEE